MTGSLNAKALEALQRLVKTANLLLQNSIGCATNHYGEDYALHGLPGFLLDAESDIVAAQAALSALPQAGTVSDEMVGPAECDPNCDDPECPYSHQPLTLRQAYENALSRLRIAEAALSLRQQEEAVPVAWRYRWRSADEWSDWALTEMDPDDWKWLSHWSGLESVPLYASPVPADAPDSKQGAVPVADTWTRDDLAFGLASLDGVTLYDIRSTVGPSEDANNWRDYLGRADDLLAFLSAGVRTGGAS